ncbi:MAG: hypothetical protein ACREPW_02825 [Candidatus Binataceae bacterium]
MVTRGSYGEKVGSRARYSVKEIAVGLAGILSSALLEPSMGGGDVDRALAGGDGQAASKPECCPLLVTVA